MSPSNGVAKIVRFNWPWYALALGAIVAGAVIAPALPVRMALAAGTALAVAAFWLVASLWVSYWVYDRSTIASAAWLVEIPAEGIREVAAFHAGQDEISDRLRRRYPEAHLRVFDFFDPARRAEPSLVRARGAAAFDPEVIAARLERLPLGDGELDLAVLAFAAHEIRREDERVVFFRELARVLARGGRLVVLEHLRDGWNALAYGPGAWHFLPRAAWTRAFEASGLVLERAAPATPFATIFHLRKAA